MIERGAAHEFSASTVGARKRTSDRDGSCASQVKDETCVRGHLRTVASFTLLNR